MRTSIPAWPLRGHRRHLYIVSESASLAAAGELRRDRLARLRWLDRHYCRPPLGAAEVAMLDAYAGATLELDEVAR